MTYYWLSLSWTFGDEAFFIKWSSLVRKSLLGFDDKPDPTDVLFIDVSGNKTVITDLNPPPERKSILPELGYHRKVITDRQELATLFEIMGRHREAIRYVVCDVLFEDATEYDSLLEQRMALLSDRLLTVSHLTQEEQMITPIIKAPYGLATYESTDNLFLKFPLVLRDSIKTVPLGMYEHLSGERLRRTGPFYWLGGRLALPAPIVDFRVRPSDFRSGQELGTSNFTVFPLGTILESQTFMPEEELGEYFRNKIVLIGDFETDMHRTPFGDMPGMLLIYNAFLTLEARQYSIRISWIIFLAFSFFVLSYRIFAQLKVDSPRWLHRLLGIRVGDYLVNILDEMGLLVIVTLLSYFLFNIHINILIFFLYLKLLEWVWKKWLVRTSVLPAVTPS